MNTVLKRIIDDANIKKQAEDLGLPVWRTPSVLFIFMGVVIIVAISAVYISSQKYADPEILIISEVIVTIFLFTIGNFIIQSVEQVAKMNKMKSEFVSIASHQLKAPLAEINWETELLMSRNSEGLNEKQKELIERIEKSNTRMARLVNDLLDVARIEQDKLLMNSENVDLGDIIEKVIENNSILARANNVEIKFE